MKRFTRWLFPPLDREHSTLALRPLMIGGMVTPVVAGDGGVNIQIVQGNPAGVLSAVDPWLRMEVGDHLDIFWDNALVGTHDVEDVDIDNRLFFYLPSAAIEPDWAERVYYRLTRANLTPPEDSSSLKIRVKLDHPGGVDKDPHLPGHSELAAVGLPQDVIDNGVDAVWAARGVPAEIAAYPGRAAQDTIQMRWGDAMLSHLVTPAEAAGSAPIIITVDQAAILKGGDSPNLLVEYQVFDEVWNFSTDWSLSTRVKVEAGAQRLDAPIIREAFNGVIDLGDLGSNDVTVQIEMRGPPFQLNDTITMTWTGTPRNGLPRVYTDTVTITSIPSVAEVKVPNAEVRAILEGRAEADYVLNKANGDPPQSSKRAIASVTGQIPLPAPIVLEVVGDTLDPTLERAHVVIPVYTGMAVGDLIDMIWLGLRQNGTPYLYEVQHIVTGGEIGNVIYIPVMGEHIAILASGTLDVSYRVSNDALDPRDVRVSDPVNLVVAQRFAELPAPSVDEAVEGDVLDPELVPIFATYRMPYTGTVAGDILTWYWQGENPDGSASDWLPVTTATAGKPITFNIPRSLIEPNINNVVKLYYSLKLASTGKYQYSAIRNLTIGKLIGDLPPTEVPEAKPDGSLDPMQAQSGATARVRYASMDPQDIITLSWRGSMGAGTPPEQQMPGSASGFVDFPVPASAIGANIGRNVLVTYQVKRYVTEKQSAILSLDIDPIADNQLPSPLMPQADAQTKVLNLATFSGNPTTTVSRWPFIALGQRAWLRLEGQTETGGPYSIVLLDGTELTSAQVAGGLSQSVLRSELEKLGQDTTLTAICNVAFDGVAAESNALPLPPTVYTFKLHHDWVTPVIVNVRDSQGEVGNAGTTFETTLHLSGTGTIDTELEILDGTSRLLTTRTSATGTWTVDLTALAPKSYSVTARALDNSGLVSQPRTWEVLANLTPTIEQLLDSRGPVANGGTTVDNAATLSGKASPDQEIELFNGTVSLGRATTNGSGAWAKPVSGLAVALHSFKAKALYGTGPESTVWTLTVTAAVAPTISSIKDSDTTEIPPGGFTVDTRVILSGNASANLEVEVFDGAISQGKATANASGVWTLTLSGLSIAAHAMKARALYGSGAESAVRSFTIVAVVAPTITAVVDPQNRPITEGGSTYASTVTATGRASIHQQVEVFDGGTSKGTATASATGVWTRAVSGLGVASHTLTARALYGTRPVSPGWTFTVKAATVPTIVNVRDTKGEVGNGGSTIDTTVTASGKAAASELVEVFDGATSKGTASVNAAGDWSHSVSGLALGAHSLKAVGKYGDEPASNIRSFTVRSPVPDFVMDSSPVTLSGLLYVPLNRPDILPNQWPAGTQVSRTPSSGAPPYTYTSSSVNIVTVSANGVASARARGAATITVRDSQGRSGSYSIQITGVIYCKQFQTTKYPWARDLITQSGYRMPSMTDLRAIYSLYGGRWPQGNDYSWSGDGRSFNTNWVKNLVTGAEGYGFSSLIPHSLCIGTGIQ